MFTGDELREYCMDIASSSLLLVRSYSFGDNNSVDFENFDFVGNRVASISISIENDNISTLNVIKLS